MSAPSKPTLALAGILLLALVLRLLRLDSGDLWLDEACSVHYATLPWADLRASFASEIHPPLYYLLLRAWVAAFGPGAEAVHALSLLAGVALVGVTARLGQRLVGQAGALAGALALAVMPLAVYYAVEARPYALAFLLVVLALERWLVWAWRARWPARCGP